MIDAFSSRANALVDLALADRLPSRAHQVEHPITLMHPSEVLAVLWNGALPFRVDGDYAELAFANDVGSVTVVRGGGIQNGVASFSMLDIELHRPVFDPSGMRAVEIDQVSMFAGPAFAEPPGWSKRLGVSFIETPWRQAEVFAAIDEVRDRSFEIAIDVQGGHSARRQPTTVGVEAGQSIASSLSSLSIALGAIDNIMLRPANTADERVSVGIAQRLSDSLALRQLAHSRVEHSFSDALARTVAHPTVDGMFIVVAPPNQAKKLT